MPFHQPKYVQCTYDGLTFVLLCVLVIFADNARCQLAIEQYGFPLAVSCFLPAFSVVTAFNAEKFLSCFNVTIFSVVSLGVVVSTWHYSFTIAISSLIVISYLMSHHLGCR